MTEIVEFQPPGPLEQVNMSLMDSFLCMVLLWRSLFFLVFAGPGFCSWASWSVRRTCGVLSPSNPSYYSQEVASNLLQGLQRITSTCSQSAHIFLRQRPIIPASP